LLTDSGLTEEEVILSNAASESKEAETVVERAALVLRMREGAGSLSRILKTIEVSQADATCESARPPSFLPTRPPARPSGTVR